MSSLEKDSSKKVNLSNDFLKLLETLSLLKSQLGDVTQKVRKLEKSVSKKLRTLEKEANKNKNKGNRKPTGFASPQPISKELCKFMNMKKGTELARTEVTRYLIKYIKEKNLQDVNNKRVINPDSALKSLLKTKTKDEVTYFNLQRHMNKHFVKKKDL